MKNVVKSGEKKIIRFIFSLGFYFEAAVSRAAVARAPQKRNLPAQREAADASVRVRGNSACLPFSAAAEVLVVSAAQSSPAHCSSHIKTLSAVSLCVSLCVSVCVCERQLLALQTARAAHLEKTDLHLNDGGCHVDADRSV